MGIRISTQGEAIRVIVDAKGKHPSRTTAQNWSAYPDFPGYPCDKEQIDAFLERIGSPFAPGRVEDELADEPTSDLRKRKLAAETRIAELRALILQIEHDQKKGELAPRSEFDEQLTKLAATVSIAFENVPRSIADRLVGLESPREAEAIVSEAIREAKRALSEGQFG